MSDTRIRKFSCEQMLFGRRKIRRQKNQTKKLCPTSLKTEQTWMAYNLWLIIVIIIVSFDL
jgi:hypothetical protein